MAFHPDPLFSYPPPMTKEFGWFSNKRFFTNFFKVPPPPTTSLPVIPTPEPITSPVSLNTLSFAEYWTDPSPIENDSDLDMFEDLFSGFILFYVKSIFKKMQCHCLHFCLLFMLQVIMAFYPPPPPLIRTRTRRPKMKPYQPPKRFWLPTNEHFFVCVLTMRVHTRVYAGGRFKRTCPARVPLCTALPQLNRRVLFLFLICQ